ncbi:glycosyl hydrolase family 115 (putative glucuronidase) [Pseudoduganella flava]|uniref:Glycosyl hydrolase n=2 Tax=Pseudoduganella flava TaxID=871742 RepID=A0A562Q4R6_9BURK|nr:glycosyl hydrolase [Pseudoduganella flava]TWI51733.1 glycosyl hydrolase family 115 (putative glucuronidase) [Pseudoduganella flava]
MLLVLLLQLGTRAQALGKPPFVAFERGGLDAVELVAKGRAAPIYVDGNDHAGVLRAAGDLQADVARVSGTKPALLKNAPLGIDVVIVGTLGKSALIDGLAQAGMLDVAALRGKWEGYLIRTVTNPLPGVQRALVIAGSDKRGTIYGIYELSEQIGVSPWYWWADVPPARHKAIYANAGTAVADAPVVQYRGIFLNDEAPALTGWAKERYGGYNHRFYTKVFELILRLRGNYLWPAMWDAAFFNDDPENGRLADEYGIVMGTSHHEPMMRAHKEWARYGKGPWDYHRNEGVLKDFWRAGIEKTQGFEKIVTLGMRGDGDEPMSRDANVALLEKIVKDQREIIARQINPDMKQVPQLWALYKEVQEYYEQGMRVPDDVLLLWCDDNWGNIRRLPTPEERKRSGGAGIYYHFDYVGGPRNYKWINVTPLPKVWEQMHLAWQYDATQLWIVNVGDLKPMEVPIEFFLSYAWNPAAWPADRLQEYLRLWATREFGARDAPEIADIVAKYAKYNGRRRPEMLAPDTYSLVNYDEAARVVADYRALEARAERLYAAQPKERRDAFFQLVLHPVKAAAIVNDLYATVGMNRLYAQQGRTATNDMAARARKLFADDAALTRRYHTMGGGKWNHMMAQTHLGYTYWQQPPRNVMPAVSEVQVPPAGELGVAVEGSAGAWPEARDLKLPALDVFERRPRHVELFNRGGKPVPFTVRTSDPWLLIDKPSGTVDKVQRIAVDARWDEVPAGVTTAQLLVTGPNGTAKIDVPLHKPADAARVRGFVETGGVVAMEAEHYARAVAAPGREWLNVPDHGRTLSGMTTLPVDAPALSPQDGMRLEYDVHLFSRGDVKVHVTVAPTLKFQPGQGLRYAVALDDGAPQVVNLHADGSEKWWEKIVADGAAVFTTGHAVDKPGAHVLKVWALDPGVVLQKIVVDAGGMKASYLGPPESPRVR